MHLRIIREVRMDVRFWVDHLISNCSAIIAATVTVLTITGFLIQQPGGPGWAGITAIILMPATMPALGTMHLLSAWRAVRLANSARRRTPEAPIGERMSLPTRTMWVWMPANLALLAQLAIPGNPLVTGNQALLDAAMIGFAAAGTACWLITSRAALADILGRRRDGKIAASGRQR